MTDKQERVYLVATGETVDGRETYTRHDSLPPMCDFETLFSAPPAQPAEPVQLTETEIFKAYTTATGKVLPNMGSSRAELVAITRIVERAHGITGEKNDR